MSLMIIDGNSIINRAFYGVHELSAPDGTPTNAVFGFINIVSRLLDTVRPDSVAVAFDLHAPTFRHKAYEGYKATRKGMPEELALQMPILKELLDNMSVRRLELEGYEADDILGTLSQRCDAAGEPCTLVTGDRDSLQLISSNTSVCLIKTRMGNTETTMYTPELFRAEYGFDPIHLIDLKALMGDSSDNIPGVPGIGEKTALDLVRRYNTLEAVYAGYENDPLVKPGMKTKLSAGRESAELSYMLATIVRDVPISFDPDSSAYPVKYLPALRTQLRRLGFIKLLNKLDIPEEEASVGSEAQNNQNEPEPFELIEPDALFDYSILLNEIAEAELVAVRPGESPDSIDLALGGREYRLTWSSCGDSYNEILRALFSPEIKKIGYNVKDLMGMLLNEGLSLDGFVFDLSLAAYLLDCLRGDYSLSYLSEKYLGREYRGVCDWLELYTVMDAALTREGLHELFYEIELPLCSVLADMEHTGFSVNKTALREFGESLTGDIEEQRRLIYELADCEFNINSPKQLGAVLFDKLMLPGGKKTKTGWSTNADVLEKLLNKHPIVEHILEYRTLTKLKSTYAEGLLQVIAEDGRIHTNFQMTVTATGRLSSTEPNLQNIPVRRELGARIRKMFIPSPGNVLVDADYSQIELRLLAHMADDKNMLEAFSKGQDFHTLTAARVFGVPVGEVTSQMRSSSKAVNFGVVYGISAFALSQDIHVPVHVAQKYMDSWFSTYSGVKQYMDNVIRQADEEGRVKTLYGRFRPMPELKNPNMNIRNFGIRVARNMPIQGTAADIIKLAMIRVYKRIKSEKLSAKLLLQVHDELIVDCPESEAETVSRILTEEMQSVAGLKVPLLADAGVGHSWAEAH